MTCGVVKYSYTHTYISVSKKCIDEIPANHVFSDQTFIIACVAERLPSSLTCTT